MTPELLLSDKFVEFSQKISALHENKKRLSVELKKIVEEGKANLKKIDDEAVALTVEFETWQKEQGKK
jgi:uncharacterized protein YggU (UPF0235/DUF167 family)